MLEDDDGFMVYETVAIDRYLHRRLKGPPLVPADERAAALMSQWLSAGQSYFSPNAGPVIVETVFRRYLGGEHNAGAVQAGRQGMQVALDAADRRLAANAYFAGKDFSLADIHWMPYFEYLVRCGHQDLLEGRRHLAAWWERVSARSTWQAVARTGPQPYEAGIAAEVIEKRYRA